MRVKLYIQYVADLHYADAEPDCQIEKMRIRKPLRTIHDCCRSFLTLLQVRLSSDLPKLL